MSTIRVFSYGAKRPSANRQEVSDQIFRANRYRNDLCALERNRRERMDAEMQRIFPQVKELTDAVEAAENTLECARDKQKAENAVQRNRRIAPEAKKEIDALRVQRNELYGRLKKAKSDAYGPDYFVNARKAYGKKRTEIQKLSRKKNVDEHSGVAELKSEMDAAESRWYSEVASAAEWQRSVANIEAEHNSAAKKLRAACGLGWGTYLTVEAAADKFRKGPPPKFKRFRGDGSIGAQSQKKISVRDAMEASKGQIGIDGYDPGIDKKQRASVRLRIGTGEKNVPIYAAIPAVIHRAMPEDAEIAWTHLHRKRIGTRDKYTVNFTLSRAAGWEKKDLADRGSVGIDVGWRLIPTGLRVAYWFGNDGRKGELILPQKLLDNMARPDAIKSERDLTFNAIRPIFQNWLVERWATIPQWLSDRCSAPAIRDEVPKPEAKKYPTVILWKSQNRLAALVKHWWRNRFDGDKPMFGQMEEWRRHDEEEFNKESWGRHRAILWRREIYRTFAATMRRDYAKAFIEDIDWKKMDKLPEAEQESQPGAVRQYRRVASPGFLHEIIWQNFREIVKRDAKDTTRIHYACGEYSGEPNPENLHHVCAGCGKMFDQDESAAFNLLYPPKVK